MGRGTMIRLLLVVPLLAAGIALGAPLPAAAATICDTTIRGGTIKDSIVVPNRALCQLVDVTVRGGVSVEAGGSFLATDSEIRGAVSGTGVVSVDIHGGVVRGGVTVAGSSFAGILAVEVRGTVVLTGAAVFAYAIDSTVRGGVTLNDNADVEVYSNTIGADLTCSGNGEVTDFGFSNTVGGAKLGDCAGL